MSSESQTPPRVPRTNPPSIRRRTRAPYVSPPRPRPIGRTHFQIEEDADQGVRRRLGFALADIQEDPEVQTPVKWKTESKFSPSKKQKLFK